MISERLRGHKALRSLNLSGNNIGATGAVLLCGALASQCALTELKLANNSIADEGAKAVSELLQCNSLLQHIDLRLNYIGNIGAKHLAGVLGLNNTVTCLNLSNNDKVLRPGHQALGDVLRNNYTLTELSEDKEFAQPLLQRNKDLNAVRYLCARPCVEACECARA